MKKKFKLDSFIISDYASRDGAGKFLIAGGYMGELSFQQTPEFWPPLFILISIQPLFTTFDFCVEFESETGIKLFSIKGNYHSKSLTAAARIALQLQIPVQPFSGPGQYRMKVWDPVGQTSSEAFFVVRVGQQTDEPADLNVEFSPGPILATKSKPPSQSRRQRTVVSKK